MFITPTDWLNKRPTISRNYRRDENAVMAELLPIATISPARRNQAWNRARDLVVGIRLSPLGKGGVDALLSEFALSSEEGVVLMCLAEALLRIPDKITTDRLIRDKLGGGDWVSHLGNSESLFVNASAWGLLLTGKVVSYKDEDQQANVLKRAINRLGEPVIRSSIRIAMQIMGAQFVMGTNIQSALKRARAQEAQGYQYSYDMLGEGARTMEGADRYLQSYHQAIEKIGQSANERGPLLSPGISVKLSAIHPRYELAQRNRVISELVPRLKQLAVAAKHYDVGFTVDAEEADRLDLSLEIIELVFSDQDLDGWQGFGIAIQAYQKRALEVVDWVKDLSVQVGRKMMVRLVKGAYWDSEIKWSQEGGYEDYPVFTRKQSTDVCYQACARRLLAYREYLYPQFASHNAYTVATILALDDNDSPQDLKRQGYEFQRLHGMGESLYNQILEEEKVPCRIYAPVGEHANLLAYLVRRLLENGANSSFVNNIVDEAIPIESLLNDPVETVRSWQTIRNERIALPGDLYDVSGEGRKNSIGDDLSDIPTLERIKTSMSDCLEAQNLDHGEVDIFNPSALTEKVGSISYQSQKQMLSALDRAVKEFPSWSTREVADRVNLLRKLADALEDKRFEFAALCIKEAGKTLPDALSEVREAIDFCRYYADQALLLKPNYQSRGVILCISPWNFPLAIFLGQVSAALVSGNTVLAKPAEQTTLIALMLKKLMIETGFPLSAMEIISSPGHPVGAYLVPDSRIRAVMFTGSSDTARLIARGLADRADSHIPLIAETGGQNAMIVDSTALPEQVVDDVIMSGFLSAGQRCSALRVLFLQEEIADAVIRMIKGAMNELIVANPALLSTDIGPLIDEKAKSRLYAHLAYLSGLGSKAKCLHQLDLDSDLDGHYFAPCLYEIDSLSILEEEVFGPIVHIVRYKAKDLEGLIEQINQTSYGLTLGIHSRIQTMCETVARRVKVGNIYVNRNMIGAVVGVQPFGGCALSGTGPKAGGPAYLKRLVTYSKQYCSLDERDLPLGEKENLPFKENTLMNQTQQHWSLLEPYQRVSVIRRVLAQLSKESLFDAETLESLILTTETLIEELDYFLPQKMPGPTGESNILSHEARGIMALLWEESMLPTSALARIFAGLMSGNAVFLYVESRHMKCAKNLVNIFEKSGLPNDLVVFHVLTEAGIKNKSLKAILVIENSRYTKSLEILLSRGSGALTPLIQNLDLDRFSFEKTVTIDTTAAGGNASLMSL